MLVSTLIFLCFSSFADGLATLVYGPQAPELLLLTSKLAAKAGIDTSCMTSPGTEGGCRRLMYGVEYGDAGKDEAGRAKPVSGGEDIQEALTKANSLVLVCYDQPVDAKSMNTLLGSAGEDLKKVVMLSKMGVSMAKGGFFGGGEAKLLESENLVRDICKSKNLDLSIIRGGVLKGGGAGTEGNDFGLDKCYYNTLIDIVEAKVTMAHDQFSLGADCTKGDTIEFPNPFAKMNTKASFDPSPSDTNRVVLAGAIVAAMQHEKPVELSVSTEKGEEPPTAEAWEELLQSM
jgi:hypothetical protein